MVKKLDNKHKIFIELTLKLAKNGYIFLGTVDLGEPVGNCDECGHLIRYEQQFRDKTTGEEYIIGSDCMFKIFIFEHWENQIVVSDLEDSQLLRAGKWLWVLHRDHDLSRWGKEIPEPKDYITIDEEDNRTSNFKKLADDLKNLVFKIRRTLKKEVEQRQKAKELEEARKTNQTIANNFLSKYSIDLDKCSTRDKEFLATVLKCERKGWTLSEKQQKWFDNIIRRSNESDEIPNETINESVIPESYGIVEKLAKRCKGHYEELNDWERKFVESVIKQSAKGYQMSPKQITIIEKIMNKFEESEDIAESDDNYVEPVDKYSETNDSYTKHNDSYGNSGDNDEFVGKNVKAWKTKEISGMYVISDIVAVKKKTDDAILADVKVENQVFPEEWIPKSAICEEVVL